MPGTVKHPSELCLPMTAFDRASGLDGSTNLPCSRAFPGFSQLAIVVSFCVVIDKASASNFCFQLRPMMAPHSQVSGPVGESGFRGSWEVLGLHSTRLDFHCGVYGSHRQDFRLHLYDCAVDQSAQSVAQLRRCCCCCCDGHMVDMAMLFPLCHPSVRRYYGHLAAVVFWVCAALC